MKLFIIQLVLLVIQLITAIFHFKIISICLMILVILLSFLGLYIDNNTTQVRYFCLIHGELLLLGKTKEADELYNKLTSFQKYLFKEMKK